MAGTITVSTISDGTNSGSATDAIKGSCRAWVNFNGSGTLAVRASYNISSVTDNGTGDYSVNLSNAMTDKNFCATLAISGAANGWHVSPYFGDPGGTNNDSSHKTASQLRFVCYRNAASGDRADPVMTNVAFFR